MGSISLTAIEAEEKGASWAHEICIQCECQTTPQPHVPEASDQMMSSNGLEGLRKGLIYHSMIAKMNLTIPSLL